MKLRWVEREVIESYVTLMGDVTVPVKRQVKVLQYWDVPIGTLYENGRWVDVSLEVE